MKKQIIFNLSELMTAYKTAEEENNESLSERLKSLFITGKEEISIDLDDEIVPYILNQSINLESIILSYAKAIYKNNSEVKNKLKKILFQFMENIENDIDSTYLIETIKADKELFQYIRKTTTVEELKQDLKIKKKKKKTNIQNEQKDSQLIKGKPFIN